MLTHHERRKDQILEVIGDGEMTAWEVAVAIWGRRESLLDMRMALQEGLAHLQSLSRDGRLEKRAEPGHVTWLRPGGAGSPLQNPRDDAVATGNMAARLDHGLKRPE
jgi:hypothetical protein